MQRSRAILVLGFGLATASAAEQPCFDAQPWADADRMFRSSSEWLGGDSAFSIDLGNDRTLWLFGDSWIDRDGEGVPGLHYVGPMLRARYWEAIAVPELRRHTQTLARHLLEPQG